jgi:hypothetical protein
LLIEACHRTDRQKQKWAIGPLLLLQTPASSRVLALPQIRGEQPWTAITRAAKQNSPMRGYF